MIKLQIQNRLVIVAGLAMVIGFCIGFYVAPTFDLPKEGFAAPSTEAAETGAYFTWPEANEYCKNLAVGDKNDWRIPTLGELFNIANDPHKETKIEWNGASFGYYWTSTPVDDSRLPGSKGWEDGPFYGVDRAYLRVDFQSPRTGDTMHVLCVR